MKKLLAILVLGLLWCNVSFAEELTIKTKASSWCNIPENQNIRVSGFVTFPGKITHQTLKKCKLHLKICMRAKREENK